MELGLATLGPFSHMTSSSCLEAGLVPCISPQCLPGPLHSLTLLACPLQEFEFKISDMPHHPFTSLAILLAILGSFNWVGNKNGCLI